MENATSIYNLAQETDEPSQRKMPVPVMSYSDVLKSMQEEPAPLPQATSGVTSVEPRAVPPALLPELPPVQVQAVPPQQVQQQPETEKQPDDFQSKSFQNDMLVLLSVYIVVHMATVQKWIQTKVPNLINPDTGAMSVLGLLMNGVLVIVLWNISKKLVAKYLKEL